MTTPSTEIAKTSPPAPLPLFKPPACALVPFEQLETAGEAALARLAALAEDSSLEVATRQQIAALLGSINPNKKGLDADVEVNLQLPELIVCQKMTEMGGTRPENAKEGDILTAIGRKATGILPPGFKFRVLFEYQSYVKFEEGEKAPTCSSPDGKLGNPQGECSKCPDLPMGKQAGGWNDQKQSACSAQLCYILVDSTFEQLYEIKFAKTSLGAGRNIATLIRASKGGVWESEFALTTEKKTSDKGTYAVFKATPSGGAKATKDQNLFCDALSDLYITVRHKVLNKFYGGVLTAASNAESAEKAIADGQQSVMDGLKGGSEVPFDVAPPAAAAAKTGARKSSTPM